MIPVLPFLSVSYRLLPPNTDTPYIANVMIYLEKNWSTVASLERIKVLIVLTHSDHATAVDSSHKRSSRSRKRFPLHLHRSSKRSPFPDFIDSLGIATRKCFRKIVTFQHGLGATTMKENQQLGDNIYRDYIVVKGSQA